MRVINSHALNIPVVRIENEPTNYIVANWPFFESLLAGTASVVIPVLS